MESIGVHDEVSFWNWSLRVLLFLLALTGVCSARPKKDVLQFTNGDRVTCEIIKLEKGYLYVKLEYADGTVAMDWSKVARVESSQSFVVTEQTGKRYTGSLQAQMATEATPVEKAERRSGNRRAVDKPSYCNQEGS